MGGEGVWGREYGQSIHVQNVTYRTFYVTIVVDINIRGAELCSSKNLLIMKKSIVFLLFLVLGLLSYSQTAKKDKMPVTTASKSALEYYNQAMKYFDDVAFGKALDLLTKSLNEDPDFFMANYQTAMYYSFFANMDKFKEHANAANNCKAKLSPAEELLKSAISKLKENQTADVTAIGRKLTEMYPKDANSYGYLFSYQSFIRDTLGGLETLKKELALTDNPAPVYNMLGYVYMSLNQFNEAEKAFDKYIQLAPGNPNVYDSKGDFYMSIKEYYKAYDSYMKANSMDTAWSYDKAQKAKQLSKDMK